MNSRNEQENLRKETAHPEMDDAQRALIENCARILALEDKFESLYDVDLETGDYELYIKGQTFGDDINTRMVNSRDFFTDTVRNAELVVYPEDRAGVIRVLDRSYIREMLEKESHFDWFYRLVVDGEPLWIRMRVLYKNPEKRNIIVGVFNAEEEMAEKERDEKRQRELLERMTADDAVFLIDFVKDTRKTVHNRLPGAEDYRDDERPSVSFGRYVDTYVAEADREMMHRVTSAAYMRKRLRSQKEYTVVYSDITSGFRRFYEMRIAKVSETEVLQSFKENDDEIINRQIFNKLSDDYFALFAADLDSGLMRVLKNIPGYLFGKTGTVVPYTSAVQTIAELFEDETRTYFAGLADIAEVQRRFAKESKAVYMYRSHLGKGNRWGSVTELVLARHEDGTPSLFALGFSLLDHDADRIQNRLKEDERMIGGLASDYQTLYYVNIDDNIVNVYSLDRKENSKTNRYLRENADPFGMLREFGCSATIHPEDRPLFIDLTAETFRERLTDRKRFSIRFRRSFGGEYLWCEMDVVKYEAVHERANSIVVGFAERDGEIRSEQAMSRCFRILGKEIPPDAAIKELLALAGEFYEAERAYIFEFSESRNVISNTFEWCAEGIMEMLPLLQNVPAQEIDGWMREFRHQGAFAMDSLDDSEDAYGSEEGRELLEMQGIESLLAAPIMSGDEIVGFIGVDNPSREKKEIAVLKNISVVAFSEILKRREAETAMSASAKTFAEVFLDSYVSAFYVNLRDCSQVVFSRSALSERNYGHISSYLESMNRYISECVHPEDREMMYELARPETIRERLKTERSFSVYMRDISGKEVRWYRFEVMRGTDDDHAGLAFSDVTEQLAEGQRSAKALRDALDAADAANKSKTSFLFNMSHDIRTPMNAIKGFTAMAKKYAYDPEKVSEYLDKINISGEQLLTLINQVLEMARIESGRIDFDLKPVNIQTAFDSMVTVLAEQANSNGLEFHYSLRDVRHFRILADEARMSSITLNIAGNAMKYTPAGGRIDYSLTELPQSRAGYGTYTLTVSDTGIGMSEEYQKILFEPFSREKNSTVSRIQGTGLGMSIVKNLVDLLGGTIRVRSEPGKGTRFDVTVDLKLDEQAENDADAGRRERTLSFEGRRVLLVEDNEMNREIAKDILEEQGFEVEEADDGDVAVSMVRTVLENGEDGYYDLILMDIQMPRMDGYEATKAIRALPFPASGRLPIIAMTANAFEEDRQNAFDAGMDEHLAKPIEIDKLKNTIARFLI